MWMWHEFLDSELFAELVVIALAAAMLSILHFSGAF
jgi:hypothetical protein